MFLSIRMYVNYRLLKMVVIGNLNSPKWTLKDSAFTTVFII